MRGFTLIEMLLSVAIVAALAAMSVPIYQSFQVRDDLDIATQSLVQNLRRASLQAGGGVGDGGWGVKITTSTLVLFLGNSYATRSTTVDEVISFPTSLTATGTTEYLFARFSGNSLITGTTTMISNANESRSVSVNPYGIINY
ncbi:MAG TPA: prepilin-type N-terminal cleavage/methylation domain-containing protein [Candidatus Magasanikbacteria bacterium]|nr:prepilin-type N-terminal cleavage/methylation domain-containing protein [Candidatus Magasanikbacteria bacterium]